MLEIYNSLHTASCLGGSVAFICFVDHFISKIMGNSEKLWYFSNDRNKFSEWKYTRNKLFIKDNGLIHYFFGSPGYI